MKSTTTLLAVCPDGRTTTLEFSHSTIPVEDVHQKFEEKEGIPSALQSLRFVGGDSRDGWVDLDSVVSVHVNLKICGGKGGFGSLLKSEGRKKGNNTPIFNPARHNAQAAKRQKFLAHYLTQRNQGEGARQIQEAKRRKEGERTLKEEAAWDHIRQHHRDRDVTSEGIQSALRSVRKELRDENQLQQKYQAKRREEKKGEWDFLQDDYLIPLDELSDECFESDDSAADSEEGGDVEFKKREGCDEECEKEEEIVWVPVNIDDYVEEGMMDC